MLYREAYYTGCVLDGMRAVGIPNLTLPQSYDSQAALALVSFEIARCSGGSRGQLA